MLHLLQTAPIICVLPQCLNGIHDQRLVCQKCFADRFCPFQIFTHPAQQFRKCNQCLDAGIPVSVLNRLTSCVGIEMFVILRPPVSMDYLQWIGRRNEDMGEDGIGIERDGGK